MSRELLLVSSGFAFLVALLWILERRKFSAKEVSLIAVLAALAALGRVSFVAFPSVQPTTFLVITSGAVFGSSVGLAVGAFAPLVSNVFLGHGPWTFFQMLAWGLCGLSAGCLLRCFPRLGIKGFVVFGFVWGYLFGWITNFWHWYTFVYPLNIQTWLATNITSFWFDTAHAITNAICFLVMGYEFILILQRFKGKLSYCHRETAPKFRENISMDQRRGVKKVRTNRTGLLPWGLAAALLGILVSDAVAVDVDVPEGFSASVLEENASGGFDFLPNGDAIAFVADFVNGPRLQIFDANNDGSPILAQVILSLPPTAFGQFVRVSPDGSFAIVGTGGSDTLLRRVDLSNLSVSPLIDAPGNFELVFIDNSSAYLSSNPGGFDPAVPNRISLLELNGAPTLTTIAEIQNTPSGPIDLNSRGDLYYVKGTFAFPPPAGSFTLLRFSRGALSAAAQNGTPLSEGDSEIALALDGGFGMAINRANETFNDIYLSTTGDEVLKISEDGFVPEVFSTVSDPGNASPSVTYLRFSNPGERFEANGPRETVLGAALAAKFFSEFLFAEVAPLPLDSDGDGALDIDELEEGSDPFDRGSVPISLLSPAFALWNGFLRMINILELVNTGDSEMVVDVCLYANDGSLTTRQPILLAPGEQVDLILNDLFGFAVNSIGLVKLEFHGSLDGRLSFYRPAEKGSGFDFVFSVALSNAVFGKIAAAFNTFQPSLAAVERENRVEAWLSIANLSNATKRYAVKKFDQRGALLERKTVEVAAFSRVDTEAGHVVPGPSRVGQLVVEPEDSASPNLVQLIRYGRSSDGSSIGTGYNFASALLARAGSGRPMVSPISRELGGQNWLEVMNCLEKLVRATVRCFGSDSRLLREWQLELDGLSQLHLNVSQDLFPGESGHCVVTPHTKESIVSQSMRYFNNPDSGAIAAISGFQLQEVLGSSLFGTYNLFLGMDNVLRVLNPSSKDALLRLLVNSQSGVVERNETVPAHGVLEFLLHNTAVFGTSRDSYGVVQLISPDQGQLVAETARSRLVPETGELDYHVSTPVR